MNLIRPQNFEYLEQQPALHTLTRYSKESQETRKISCGEKFIKGEGEGILTIQRRAVSVIWEYSVMVERTLNIRQVRTDKKLTREETFHFITS